MKHKHTVDRWDRFPGERADEEIVIERCQCRAMRLMYYHVTIEESGECRTEKRRLLKKTRWRKSIAGGGLF